MKTLKRNDDIIRVADTKADSFLKQGYSFCPKTEWKKNVRDVSKAKKEESKETVKAETKKVSKKK